MSAIISSNKTIFIYVPQFLREEEAHRIEEAGNKLRSQRLEAEEKKREREVKLTDGLPPPKRQRTGCMPFVRAMF